MGWGASGAERCLIARRRSLVALLVAVFSCHVPERMRLPVVARYRMILQVLVQARMTIDVAVIVDQRRILLQLLCYLGMRVHIMIGRRQRMPVMPFMVVVVVALARHEAIRVILQLFADLGMIPEVLVHARMSRQELRVVDQARIAG